MVKAENNNRTNVGQLVLKKAFLPISAICMRNDIKCFIGDWYLSGDLAKDADGYFWFIGRADERIKCLEETPLNSKEVIANFNHFKI
jgi:acyl-coenzyme A synthetase/AMP-(fatty) acid ligase